MPSFTTADVVTLDSVYRDALPDAELRDAEMSALCLSDAGLLAVANYAADVARVEATPTVSTDPVDVTDTDGRVIAQVPPELNILAGIEDQLTRIAENTGHAPTPITAEQAVAVWTDMVRMYEDLAVPYLKALGITVDE
ncbi:hypothetical protein [Curtobacterium sp. MCBD17_028]|uniref:hypothetical protein n=1 Tax=Curtobacterium sp. MCBD17_028 TaxID=2175670 RepID=UPI000DA85200|nr:hypothetical protein [Curtobacterium sp. MCBD17_028]PZE23867.1 hypothetical protein DEI86_13570 [Curtobacterium sp. MCBD17_028]